MKVTRPAIYDAFHCVAAACPDSCCQEWAVVVDDDKAALYRGLPGPLGDRLRQVLREEDGETLLQIQNGRCPMWRQDGLCRIQAELGEAALCQTCRDFPRLTHDYGNFKELQLELSCPEAARLILSGDQTQISEEQPGGEEPQYDADAMAVLLKTRERALALINDPALPVQKALSSLLLYGYSAQEQLDGGEGFEPDPGNLAGAGDSQSFLDFYRGLEILTDRWRQRLQTPDPIPWTDDFRPLAAYFIRRYWLQAVSDYDLVGRVKLIVCSCLAIRLVGGDLRQTAQLYAKEIENDADNVDALLDGAYGSPALTDKNLLSLFMQ